MVAEQERKRRQRAARKARQTRIRRYERTTEWKHPYGSLFHGVEKGKVTV